MAVGALQERGVPVPRQLRHRLLVYPMVQKRGDEVVPQRVEMILLRKPEILIDHPEMFGEGIRVEEMSFIVHEEVV